MLGEEIALKLQAEIDEEERIARAEEEKIDEANIAWDDIQAKVDADYQLAERLQVTAALIDVNAAQSKLVLLENFNENYSKCLRLLVKLQPCPVQVNTLEEVTYCSSTKWNETSGEGITVRVTLSSVKGEGGSDKDSALPKGKCPGIASSLLEKMNEFVEIGQAMGFFMDGCLGPKAKKQCGNMYFEYSYSPSVGSSGGKGFEQLVKDSWHNDVVVDINEMSYLKKKFQMLKKKIKMWVQQNRIKANDKRNEIQEKLLNIDKQIDQAGGQEDLLNSRWDIWKDLLDLDALREKELVQKAKIRFLNEEVFSVSLNKHQHDMLEEEFWEVIGGNVCWAVKCLFRSGSFPKGCNPSFIALIPKVNDAKFVKDFRPISLIGSQYKIVGKILANRLSDRLVQPEKEKDYDFKVDFENAYDSVKWDFLDMILYRFGFGDTWRGRIKGCLVSSSALILVNESPTREFCFEQGLHQRDPLSPFLFLLVMESLHISFVRAMEGGFFKVPKEVLKRLESCRSSFFRGMVPGTRKVSWFSWDSVVASKEVGGLGKRRGFIYVKKAGNGSDSLFWLENWLGEGERQGGAEAIKIEELTNLISSFEFVVEQDNWVWNLDGEGVFSMSPARRFIDEGLCVMEGSPTRWLNLIPIKVNVLA
ncbi:RNA-directed DNA polymerase, eukaryota [Tanacetum coccineum]